MKTVFLSSLLPFVLMPLIFCLPYNLTYYASNSGIFFQNLGSARISNDHFTLLSFSNISFLNSKLQLIKNTYDKMSAVCEHVKEEEHTSLHCESSLTSIEVAIIPLQSKLESVYNLIGHNFYASKARRGVFDGVSYVTNWLFGIPDAKDAEFYSQSINDLLNDNRQTQTLMKSQINLISDTITNYNASAFSFKDFEGTLNSNIKVFNDERLIINANITKLTLKTMVLRQLSLLNTLISDVREQLDILIESILFTKQNVLHPSVITPKSLKSELEKIKVGSNLQLPFPPTDYNNVQKYFSVSKLSAFFDGTLLIFTIKIPLVTEILYNLYHLIPLPSHSPNSNVYSYIDPQYPFLLLSNTRTKYSRMNDPKSCTSTGKGEYLCPGLISYSSAQNPVCETRLITDAPQSVPTDCITRTLKANLEIWHPLDTNTWLFTITKPTAATISCESSSNEIIDLPLNGTGTISLQQRCQIHTFSTTLTSTSNHSANYTNFFPKFNISSDDCCVHQDIYLTNDATKMQPLNLIGLNLDDLRHTKHRLEQFEETLQSNINKPHFVTHSTWYQSYIMFTAVLIFILLTYVCCCKCCNCHWIPIIGNLWPKSNKNAPFDLSKICITNVNKYDGRRRSSFHSPSVPEISEDEEERIQLSPVRKPTSNVSSTRSRTRSQSIYPKI